MSARASAAGPPPRSRGRGTAARREHSLLALAELGRTLDLQLEERDLAELGLLNLLGHFGAPRGAVWLRDEAGAAFVPVATVGVRSATAAELAVGLAALPETWPVGETVPLAAGTWLGAWGAAAGEAGLSLLARLEGRAGALGFVALASPSSRRRFDAFDRELVSASLGILAAAVENGRLLRSLHRGNAQLAATNRRMEELDRLRTELLQNLNHEFRTPIAVILGAASCVRDAESGQPQVGHFLDMIELHAGQVRDSITQLLDHAELMSVTAAIACSPTDVAACARTLASSRWVAPAAAGRGVRVEIEGEPLWALADGLRLRRVLDELVTNAFKFSRQGTPVTVRARRGGPPGDTIALEVQDEGHGMTSEELAVVFEPFRQVDGSSTRRVRGLGLGLTACRRAVELMGGALTLSSEPGRGTTARIELRSA